MNKIAPKTALIAVLAGTFCAVVDPAMAHHSYAMFDRTKKISINGTIKEFQWTNPHIYIWVYVPNTTGGQDLWAIEGGSPNMLQRHGWSKHTMDPGDKVAIALNPLKDGRNGGYFVTLTKADGSVVNGDGTAGTGNGQIPGTPGAAQ